VHWIAGHRDRHQEKKCSIAQKVQHLFFWRIANFGEPPSLTKCSHCGGKIITGDAQDSPKFMRCNYRQKHPSPHASSGPKTYQI